MVLGFHQFCYLNSADVVGLKTGTGTGTPPITWKLQSLHIQNLKSRSKIGVNVILQLFQYINSVH